MRDVELSQSGQGDTYRIGTRDGWGAFDVVRWHGREAISSPYEYDVVVRRMADDPADLDGLVDQPATLLMATPDGSRAVHGITLDVEELERTQEMLLYSIRIAPAWSRARFRRRSRTFVGRTLRQIVASTIENRWHAYPDGQRGLVLHRDGDVGAVAALGVGSYDPPMFTYRWKMRDTSRIDDPELYPHVAQYDETDFDFVSRLLEREGISYVFDHGSTTSVMTLTDAPSDHRDASPPLVLPVRSTSAGLAMGGTEVVQLLRPARRLRARRTVAREYDWRRSRTLLESTAEVGGAAADMTDSAFAEGDDLNRQTPGELPARIRVERAEIERQLQHGESTSRRLVAGGRALLRDEDGTRNDADLLIVSVESFAVQRDIPGTGLGDEPFGFHGSMGDRVFEARFSAVASESPFRPSLASARPRIHGIQTAVVSAEEFPEGSRPEIHTDDFGRVRVRFTWDQRPDIGDGTPSSDWVRVSQLWAGSGYGGLFTPRVGHEVLVAFLGGDPDKPMIVGRVYNPQLPPPYDPSQRPTVSTIKSDSSPDKDGFNELRFDDAADREEVFLHAERDLNETVKQTHTTSVGGSQSNGCGGDQSNAVGGSRTHIVRGSEDCKVLASRNHFVGASETVTIASGGRQVHVTGVHELVATSWYMSRAGEYHRFSSVNAEFALDSAFEVFSTTATFNQKASFVVNSATATFNEETSFEVKAGGARLSMSAGFIQLDNGAGASITLAGGAIMLSAASITSSAKGVNVVNGGITHVEASGGVLVSAGGNVDVKGALVKLNG